MYCLIWQKELCSCNYLTRDMIMDYPVGPSIIRSVLKWGRQWSQRREGNVMTEPGEKRPCDVEIRIVSRSWKRQEHGLVPVACRGNKPAGTLILSQWNWFWTSPLQNCKAINLYCYFVTKLVVICQETNKSSHRKD